MCRSQVSTLARALFETHVLAAPEQHDLQVPDAMRQMFAAVDDSLRAELGSDVYENQGSTATLALLSAHELVLGWVGDSEAIVVHKTGAPCQVLTRAHRPDCHEEAERVTKLGGLVDQDTVYVYNQKMRVGPVRVFHPDAPRHRGLAVSRALGSARLRPFVSAEPEVVRVTRSSEQAALVLASDGLWEVLSHEYVATCVRQALAHNVSLQQMSSDLARQAKDRGSTDNVSVVIVDLG
jgi:protein phosphatase 2C